MTAVPYMRRPAKRTEIEILNRLVTLRRGQRLTGGAVAKRMGCSSSAVSQFESSAQRGHSVTLERLIRYASAIGAEIHIIPTGEATQ